MATDDQLRQYANDLPRIYQEILSAFPEIEPGRRPGFGLAIQSLAAHFANEGKPVEIGQIVQASGQLEQHGIVELRHGVFLHPTPYGERLITAFTGKRPDAVSVPVLPPPPA